MRKLLTNYSLGFLNSAQFLGALNDNLFKLIVVFVLIQIEGAAHASSILSLIGALFVAPFLLFSSTAGVLADRYSKQKLLMLMKVAEMLLMALAIVAFAYRNQTASYILLFFLATHSALFGPSKYGIIPELVPHEKISKANGLITSFTYLAIILGTFLASFLTEITGKNFPLIAGLCFLIACGGFISTLYIQPTPPQKPDKKFNPLFIREIFFTLRSVKEIPHLITAVCGSAFFLFLGAFVQLNIIPFTLQQLLLSEVAGGYLFLSTAFGIALGSLLVGRFSQKINLGLVCIAGVGLFIFFLFLALFSHHLIAVILFLFLLGTCGGAFIVPCDAFIQTFSPHEKRGQVIGAVNFLSFVGVLCASFALYLFSSLWGLTPAEGFVAMGFISLLGVSIFAARISDIFLSYLATLFIKPFVSLNVPHENTLPPNTLLLLKNATPLKALFLLVHFPHTHFLIPPTSFWSRLSAKLFHSIHKLPSSLSSIDRKNQLYCLYEKTQGSCTPSTPPCVAIHIEKERKGHWTLKFNTVQTPS